MSSRTTARLLLGTAVLAVTALILRGMRRDAWCTCGRLTPWVGDAWGPENSQHLADPYTFTHVTHGVLLYLLLRIVAGGTSLSTRALTALALESSWEILENTDFVIDRYRAATMALGYHGDSVANSIGDILACMVGFRLAASLPAAATIAFTIAQEVALVLWIRDSLLLNVVMLVHPIAALKRWQLGG